MASSTNISAGTNEFVKKLVGGIGVTESTEWEKDTRDISQNIREDLVSQFGSYKDYNKKFLDYCNCIKALLAVYNFGNLPTVDGLTVEGANPDIIEKCRKNTEEDKKIIKEGVQNILKHVKEVGFDITPYLDAEDCKQIFGDGEKILIPVTISATTVMTTLVYFRRAYSRISLYSDSELTVTKGKLGLINEESTDLSDCVAQAVASIMYLFAKYNFVKGDKNKYNGWGFTLDEKQSQRTTLNDTYAVVDAISRFEDAFNQDEVDKRDDKFLEDIDYYGKMFGFDGSLVSYCSDSIYRTAYNLCERDKSKILYGKSLFYITNSKTKDEITYTHNPISYEQIASSSRSSALFNPLYVAMITMYGYNDKEVVIRRFMDDAGLAKQYFEKYEPNPDNSEDFALPKGVEYTISQYAKQKLKFAGDFETEVKRLIDPHSAVSSDYENKEWRRYYDIARVFQKYLETQLPGELMKIAEYRDYLNSTKDAIDQVQVAYRKFDDSQRLGIVDTDYIMFSPLDLVTDPVTISKLNKANISANYLRPLLLSSKIMIVNALTKYPLADMSDLYEAIKESKHRKGNYKKRKGDKDFLWLWNEDVIDMNSTARHCEAIMYDYFDYYERYELSYRALSNLKKHYNSLIKKEKKNPNDSEINYEELLSGESLSEFKRVVLNFTSQNVGKIKVLYNEHLREKDKEVINLQKQMADAEVAHQQQIDKIKAEYEQKLKDQRKSFEEEKKGQELSLGIGNTVRKWIRVEANDYLSEMLGYMILNNINSPTQKGDKDFRVRYMMRGESRDEMADGNFTEASKLSQKIMSDYKKNAEGVEQIYGENFRSALNLQSLLEGALDDLLKLNEIKDTVRGMLPLKDKNDSIRDTYVEHKRNRKAGKYNTQEEKTQPETQNGVENDTTDNQ